MGSLSKLFLRALFSFFDLFDEFLGVFVEILLAILATEFDLAVLISEHEGIAHSAQFLVRDWTGFERIGFGLFRFLRVFAIGRQCGERRGQVCSNENGSGEWF